MTPSLFSAAETDESAKVDLLELPPLPKQEPFAIGEAFFMPEDEEYFSFEI